MHRDYRGLIFPYSLRSTNKLGCGVDEATLVSTATFGAHICCFGEPVMGCPRASEQPMLMMLALGGSWNGFGTADAHDVGS